MIPPKPIIHTGRPGRRARARRDWWPRASCSARATPSRSSSDRPAWATPGPTTTTTARRPVRAAACTRRCAPTCRASSWASPVRASPMGSSLATRACSRATGRCSLSCEPSPTNPASRRALGSAPRCCAWRPSPAAVAGRRRGGEEEVEEEKRWSVAWRDGEEGEVAVEAFDAVVVCTGHCSVPLVPKLPGIENWRGKQMHSHRYRIPEPFRDQVVVVVGLGASGVDIAREISHVSKEVHIASRHDEHRLGKIDFYLNVWMHTEVNCIQDDGQLRFGEGTTMAADTILYCTGYRYHFPFLDHLDGLTVDEDDNYVSPLYKHVFPPKHAPGLSFVGLPSKTIIFQTLELVSRWVARALSGRVALPGDEGMLAAVREHCRRMEECGKPRRHTHVLVPDWVEYMDLLAEQVGEPPLEAPRREL